VLLGLDTYRGKMRFNFTPNVFIKIGVLSEWMADEYEIEKRQHDSEETK
jgi:hypothetical protein